MKNQYKKAKTIKDSVFFEVKKMNLKEMSAWLCGLHICCSCPMYSICAKVGCKSGAGWKKYLESEKE